MIKNYILVLGPQGSGKSTQGKLLAQFLDYKFVSTGELIREIKESHDPRSLELEKYWTKGLLVPDEIIIKLLFEYIDSQKQIGYVIDGFPRNIDQLQKFKDYLGEHNAAISHVFYVEVSDKECLKRLLLRRTIENREDESDQSIRNRIDAYHKLTEPLLSEYEKMGKLFRINGERSIESIQDDIREFFHDTAGK